MSTSMTLQVHVGDTLHDTGARVIDAWRRAERGNPVSEHHLSLPDLDSLHRLLSPRRMQLLRHVRQAGGAASIAALARDLGRDYRRVHGDVAALEYVGLLERDGARLVAPYDKVAVQVHADLSLA